MQKCGSWLEGRVLKFSYRYRKAYGLEMTDKKQYSQFTTKLTVWFTSFPMPLLALQRYVPSLVLLLGSRNCSPVKSTSLSVPLANTFVQVMFGTGSPSAVQVKLIAGSPSSTTWSGALVINEGGSAE